ncbi:MAG TPA: tetratricopeptide repeat protein [Bacteroidia bacterium]|nr:tetratricopeptide repeat protein [Bacteroidia bacterium]
MLRSARPFLLIFLLEAAAFPLLLSAQEPEVGPPVPTAGEEAVKRVKGLGFRLSTKSPEPGAPSDEAKGDEAAPGTPEGAPMALGRVKEPVSLPPEVAELAQKGALAVAEGKWEEARGIYLDMVKAAPDNALAYANLGVAEHQLGNLLAAAGNLGKSIEINPHIARNWQTLGLIHYQRGDLLLALSSLTRAIHEAPDEAETRLILAAVVRDYGWREAAVAELQRAVELDPKLASAHYNLAVTYLDETPPRLELARRHYYAAIDLGTPPSPEIEAVLKEGDDRTTAP